MSAHHKYDKWNGIQLVSEGGVAATNQLPPQIGSEMQGYDPKFEALQSVPAEISHIEIVRVIERLHRRSLDLMRVDLSKAGVEDLSPSQVMMLFTIGPAELSVKELIKRGYYLGSNASYNLKRLVEGGYVIRTASESDRRAARVQLTDKGIALCDTIKRTDRKYQKLVTRNEAEIRELEATYRTLKRIEQAWTNLSSYDETDCDE